MGAEGVDGLVGQPLPCLVEGFLAGQHLLPRHCPAVFGGGGVENQLGRGPDVDAGPVAFDEGDDRLIGDVQSAVGSLGDEVGHNEGAYRYPYPGSPTERAAWRRDGQGVASPRAE